MNLKSVLLVSALAHVAAAQAAVISQFDFNSVPPDASTSTGSLTPILGSASVSAFGGVTQTFASGASNGGSSDPATTDDTGLQTTTYAAQGAQSGGRGVQFNVSTVGFEDVELTFDIRKSNTSSRYVQLFYTTDGSTYQPLAGALYDGNAGDTWFNGLTADFSAIATADDNALFGVRLAPVFAPGTTTYAPSNSTGTYGATGTLRYDYVTFEGNVQAVPEPATMAALGLGAFAALRRRRKA